MASQTASQSGVGHVLIQVQGDNNTIGLPFLTLIPWRREVTEPLRDLDLLKAACQAVPVYGRQEDLNFFEDWLQGGGIRIATLIGNSGAGKTRLALKVLQRLPDDWDGGFLTRNEAERFHSTGNLSAWGWQRATLIVIDDPVLFGPVLTEWFTELALHPDTAHPLRILLLERHADVKSGWYKDLSSDYTHGDRVERLLQPLMPRTIGALSGLADRRAILAAGLQAAHRWHPEQPERILPLPGEDERFDLRLEDPQWEDPLLLLMAALVATANGLAHALSLSRPDLAEHLAKREAQRIASGGRGRDVNERKAAGELLVHLYACVILCKGLDAEVTCGVAEGEFAALRKQYPLGVGQAVDDLKRLIGPHDPIPTLPHDFLAEAFLLFAFSTLPKQGAGVISRVAPVAIESAAGMLIKTARDFGPRASEREEDPVPLMWLQALLKEGKLNPSILSAIEAALPEQTVHLRGHAVEVSVSLIEQWRNLHPGEGEGDYELARLLNNLSIRQSEMGQRERALASSAEAVEIYRNLAGANPDAFRPDLAMSLNNLSGWQSEMGQRERALASIAEAVEIRRDLAGANPDAFRPDLAMSLNNLSNRQSAMGQRERALASIAEAVDIYRALAGANPDAFRPALAMSLNNLSGRQSEMGQRERALASIAEAAEIYRELAGANPDAFRPDLAGSLNNLSNWQSEMGQRERALASIAESVEIYRELAGANPDAFRPDLAMSLNNLSGCQSEMGQRERALASIAEAVEIRRDLAGANPDAFRPALALSLNNLSNQQSEMGQRERALASIAESVEIRRDLAGANPDAFRPALALSLNNLSNQQSEMGQRERALASIAESVEIYHALAGANPDAFRPALALSLNNLSNQQSGMGQRDRALASIAEAVEIRRDLAGANPDAFRPALASSLNTLSIRQSEMGMRAEALTSIVECEGLYRGLAEGNPDAFLPDLARSLSFWGDRLMEADRLGEARDAAAESLRCLAAAFARFPKSFDGFAPATVNDYLTRTRQLGEEPDLELLAPYASLFDTPDPETPHD